MNCNYCDTVICCAIYYNDDGIIEDCISKACEQEINLEIQTEWIDCCKQRLHVIGGEGLDLQWSNGQTGATIDVDQSGTYSVTGTRDCRDTIVSGYANKDVHLFDQPFPKIIAPNTISVNSNIPENRIIRFQHFGLASGASPAYNATKYRLFIFHRGDEVMGPGAAFRVIEDDISNACTGFSNGEIFWDAKDANGNLVPLAVYVYILELYNYSYGWQRYHTYVTTKTECHKWKWQKVGFLNWKRVCVDWTVHQIETVKSIGHVTVKH